MINIIKYFTDRIKGKAPKGAKRSSQWSKVRKAYLFKQPKCEICGRTKNLEVHHTIPFYIAPELELEPQNLVTLCRKHHFTFGHLENWKSFNKNVNMDVRTWNFKFRNR